MIVANMLHQRVVRHISELDMQVEFWHAPCHRISEELHLVRNLGVVVITEFCVDSSKELHHAIAMIFLDSSYCSRKSSQVYHNFQWRQVFRLHNSHVCLMLMFIQCSLSHVHKFDKWKG